VEFGEPTNTEVHKGTDRCRDARIQHLRNELVIVLGYPLYLWGIPNDFGTSPAWVPALTDRQPKGLAATVTWDTA